MSSIIPPMVSSSPPPMDDNMEDEDDDEFGDFAAADHSSRLEDVASLSTSTAWMETTQISHCNINHVSSNAKDHVFDNEDTRIDSTKHRGLCNGNTQIIVQDSATTDEDEDELEYGVFQKEQREELETGSRHQDNTSQDSVVSGATDSGLCSASQNSDGASPVLQGDDRFSPICQDHGGSSGSDETLVKSVDVDLDSKRTLNSAGLDSDGVVGGECSRISVASSISEDFEHPVFEQEVDEKDFGNFTDFQLHSQLRTNSTDPEWSDVSQFNVMPTSSNEGIGVSDGENTISSLESSKHSSQNEFCSFDLKPSSLSRINNETEESAIDQKRKDESLGTLDARDALFTATKFDGWDTNACEQSGDMKFVSSFSDSKNGVDKSTKLFPESNEASDNWANSSATELPTVNLSLDEIDDDFYDFESAEFHTATLEQRTDIISLSSKVEVVMTTLFPQSTDNNVEAAPLQPLVEHLSETSGVWGHLQDMETSHALSYQWASSATNNMMLTALGIDSRNILFGPRWNASVPRFASNLGFSPLEPVRASGSAFQVILPSQEELPLTSHPKPEPTTSLKPQDLVPAAQFDWNSSGLVNPLDSLEQDLSAPASCSQGASETSLPILMPIRPHPIVEQILTAGHLSLVSHPTRSSYDKLGKESIKIIGGLPDLSFVRAKMLMFPVRCTSTTGFSKQEVTQKNSG